MRALPILLALLCGCGEVWNDPYPASERGDNIFYTSFINRPKHLDPVQSYAADEADFTMQVYEPPLQYHYLKRPYQLVPLTALEVPEAREVEGGRFTEYEIRIRPGIRYQPHPGFVEENHALAPGRISALKSPYELPLGTRELVADDAVDGVLVQMPLPAGLDPEPVILAVPPSKDVAVSRGWLFFLPDNPSLFVVPGLIEMHDHITETSNDTSDMSIYLRRRDAEQWQLSRSQAEAIVRSQFPQETKIRHAHVVFDTDVPKSELETKVVRELEMLSCRLER